VERRQRRLAAILAADVAGYSRLMAADESGTLSRLNHLRSEIIEPTLSQYSGRIVGSAGDSLLVEFASAVDAVECAIDLQEKLAAENVGSPENKRMVFRMGVNLGDVIAEGSTIHGDGVNIASRLEKLAQPGGLCVSDKVHAEISGKIHVLFEDMGEKELKNISSPIRAYRTRTGAGADLPQTKFHSRDPSIAVLRFANLSGDPEQQYLSDGISEDIITELSRYHSLQVIARSSSFKFDGSEVERAMPHVGSLALATLAEEPAGGLSRDANAADVLSYSVPPPV
jgi:adenylate cyclase